MKVVRFGVLWLMMLPVALAGSVTIDDVTDGRVVAIPHLREGDAFAYDLVLSSQARDIDLHVKEAFTIDVGSQRDLTVYTGERLRVVPITHTQAWIPSVTGTDQDQLRWPLDDHRRGSSQRTDMIDVETGLVVQRTTHIIEERYDQTPQGLDRWRQEETSVRLGLERAQPFPYQLRPGEAIRSPVDLFTDHLAKTFGVGSSDHVDGAIDGTFVTRIEPEIHRPSEPMPVNDIRCFLLLPQIDYLDFDISDVTRGRALDVTTERATWVSGSHALPVLQECRVRITDPGHDGALIEEVRLATVLSSYVPGTRSIHAAMAPWGRAPVEGLHGNLATDVPAPGLLDTRGAGLAYPLEDAVADLHRATDDRDLLSWVNASSGTWYIRTATYTPRPIDPVADSMVPSVLPVRPVEPLPSFEQEHSSFGWQLHLYDTGAGSLVVDAWRHVDHEGRTVQTTVTGDRLGGPSTYAAPDGPPERALPLHALLTLYGKDARIEDPLSWVDGPEGGFTIESDNRGSKHYRIGFPQTPRVHNHRTEGFQYRTNDGLMVDQWQRTQTSDEVLGPPPNSAATSADASAFIPDVRSPYAAATGVGVLTALTVLAYFWDVILRLLIHLFGFPLYAKVSKDQALDNPRRGEIHQLVTAEPGLNVSDIRRRLALGHGTVMFHLATLENVGLLTSVRVGRTRHWFAPGQVDHSAREQAAVLRRPAIKRVHEAIVANPGIHQRALADALGIRTSSLRSHLARLASVGLITASSEGQTKRYRAAAAPTGRGDRTWRPAETPA